MIGSVILQDQALPQAISDLEEAAPTEADVKADQHLQVKHDREAALEDANQQPAKFSSTEHPDNSYIHRHAAIMWEYQQVHVAA